MRWCVGLESGLTEYLKVKAFAKSGPLTNDDDCCPIRLCKRRSSCESTSKVKSASRLTNDKALVSDNQDRTQQLQKLMERNGGNIFFRFTSRVLRVNISPPPLKESKRLMIVAQHRCSDAQLFIHQSTSFVSRYHHYRRVLSPRSISLC